MGIRFKKVILKCFLRLSIQPVQLGGGGRQPRARGAREKNPPALHSYFRKFAPDDDHVHEFANT
jgi:hypothetical protein